MNYNDFDFNYNIIEVDFQPRKCKINFELTKENFFFALKQKNINESEFEKEWENFKLMASHFYDNPINFFNFNSEKVSFMCKDKGYKDITSSKVKNVVIQSDCIIYVTFADVFMLYDFSILNLKHSISDYTINSSILTIDFYISRESFEKETKNFEEENIYLWVGFINYLSSYYNFYNEMKDNINLNLFSFITAADTLGYKIDKNTFMPLHVIEEESRNGIIVSCSANIIEHEKSNELTNNFAWDYKNIHLLKFKLPRCTFLTKFEKTFTMKFEITFDYYKKFANITFDDYTIDSLKNSYISFQNFFNDNINSFIDLKIFNFDKNKFNEIAQRWGYMVGNITLKDLNIDDDKISFRLTASSSIQNSSEQFNIEDIIVKTKDYLIENLTNNNELFFKAYAYKLDELKLYDKDTFKYIISSICRLINNNQINKFLQIEELNDKKFIDCYITPISIQYKLIEK